MQIFTEIALFIVLVEAVIQITGDLRENNKLNGKVAWSIVLGLVASIGFNIDAFEMAGFTAVVPFLGNVFTGIIISRGSNYAHDLFTKEVE